MTTDRELLEQALNELEPIAYEGTDGTARRVRALRDAIRERLAQPEAEIVAYGYYLGTEHASVYVAPSKDIPPWMKRMTPLVRAHPAPTPPVQQTICPVCGSLHIDSPDGPLCRYRVVRESGK